MKHEPGVLMVGAIALFGVGVLTGWYLRGTDRATSPVVSEFASQPGELGSDALVGAAEDASVRPSADGSAAPREGARGSRREDEPSDPPTGAADTRPAAPAADAMRPRVESAEGRRSDGSNDQPSAPPSDGGAPPTGRLSREQIQDVILGARDQLGFCFAWQLHQHPELQGRLVMDFTVGRDGQVVRAEIADDQLGDEVVLSCMRGVTERMQFPPPEGGGEVRVRYPFVLRPGERRPSQD